jgi:hypothetical protein
MPLGTRRVVSSDLLPAATALIGHDWYSSEEILLPTELRVREERAGVKPLLGSHGT